MTTVPPFKSPEHEFLNLAKWYLSCRFKAMGHKVTADPYGGSLEWSLLGMLDYAAEMRLLTAEASA